MKRIRYFFQVWIGVMGGLVICYIGVLLSIGFMDWVVNFTEEQIIVGILVFSATVTAVTMTWLNWMKII